MYTDGTLWVLKVKNNNSTNRCNTNCEWLKAYRPNQFSWLFEWKDKSFFSSSIQLPIIDPFSASPSNRIKVISLEKFIYKLNFFFGWFPTCVGIIIIRYNFQISFWGQKPFYVIVSIEIFCRFSILSKSEWTFSQYMEGCMKRWMKISWHNFYFKNQRIISDPLAIWDDRFSFLNFYCHWKVYRKCIHDPLLKERKWVKMNSYCRRWRNAHRKCGYYREFCQYFLISFWDKRIYLFKLN